MNCPKHKEIVMQHVETYETVWHNGYRDVEMHRYYYCPKCMRHYKDEELN